MSVTVAWAFCWAVWVGSGSPLGMETLEGFEPEPWEASLLGLEELACLSADASPAAFEPEGRELEVSPIADLPAVAALPSLLLPATPVAVEVLEA
jgi:hypothetical protein